MQNRIALAAAFTIVLSTSAFAQSAEEQNLCMNDAFRVCSHTIPDRGRTVAYPVDGPLKVFLRDIQVFGPKMNLVRLMHVDLAAIGRLLFGKVVAHLYDTMTRQRRSVANFR